MIRKGRQVAQGDRQDGRIGDRVESKQTYHLCGCVEVSFEAKIGRRYGAGEPGHERLTKVRSDIDEYPSAHDPTCDLQCLYQLMTVRPEMRCTRPLSTGIYRTRPSMLGVSTHLTCCEQRAVRAARKS